MTGAIARANELAVTKREYLKYQGPDIKELRQKIRQEEENIRSILDVAEEDKNSIDYRIHFASIFAEKHGFDIILSQSSVHRFRIYDETRQKTKIKNTGKLHLYKRKLGHLHRIY